jgi:hypothetical protein
LKFRAEESVQSSELRGHQFGGDAIGEGAGEVPGEVVSHLGLHLNVAVDIEPHPSANADKVSDRCGVTVSEIVGEGADLDVIRVLPGDHHGRCEK